MSGCNSASYKDPVMGRLEESVLLVAMACGPKATAEIIKARLDQMMGERKVQTVLTTLERLEDKGMIETDSVQKETEGRGRKYKKQFQVTPAGVESAQRSINMMNMLAEKAGVSKVA